MTIAYLTSGLPVQDTKTVEPAVLTDYLTSGLPAGEDAHTGYHLYVARGSLNDLDFTAPDAIYPGVAIGELVGFGFDAGAAYAILLRPVVADLETPDISAQTEFVLTGGGEWTGLRPDPITGLSAVARAGGVIRLTWYHRIFDGATPDDFEINYGTTPAAAGNSTTVTYDGVKRYVKDITLSNGVTYYFKVVARDGALDSAPKATLGVTADSSAPDTPSISTSTTWLAPT